MRTKNMLVKRKSSFYFVPMIKVTLKNIKRTYEKRYEEKYVENILEQYKQTKKYGRL